MLTLSPIIQEVILNDLLIQLFIIIWIITLFGPGNNNNNDYKMIITNHHLVVIYYIVLLLIIKR